ncbi:hypothetical protein AOLI_G00113320 [Acnodon oligacanthus]
MQKEEQRRKNVLNRIPSIWIEDIWRKKLSKATYLCLEGESRHLHLLQTGAPSRLSTWPVTQLCSGCSHSDGRQLQLNISTCTQGQRQTSDEAYAALWTKQEGPGSAPVPQENLTDCNDVPPALPQSLCPRWWGKKVMGEEDWAQPPVPTELITVGKARTGSVQQEPELGPLQSRRCANRNAPEEPACYRPISQPEPRSHSGLLFEL